ncbi:MAG TPA: division/cell wall cluster transcriptional repressor MraZ [Burkholderiaceae bacterium]|nr:division/cell wall cluster transcriptional repressor MraZ [Burkholderiaceae bacterium]
MYQGSNLITLDAKGRMAVPARHRDALMAACEGRLTLTKHPHGCLMMFPRSTWEIHRERIAALPMEAAAWKRIFLGSAQDAELDGSGRVLVAPELRLAAGLTRDIMLLGMGSHFEIWDAATLAQHESAAIAQGMPDAVKQLSF